MKKLANRLLKLYAVLQTAQNIYILTEVPITTRYDLIFSDNVAARIYTLTKKLNLTFEPYDPDTSYAEDLSYFMRAVDELIAQVRAVDAVLPSDCDDRMRIELAVRLLENVDFSRFPGLYNELPFCHLEQVAGISG